MRVRRQCRWEEGCELPIWSPYSWSYCPVHFALNAKYGPGDLTRARLYFRLTLYGPKNPYGEKWWEPMYPEDPNQIFDGADILDVKPETPDGLLWDSLLQSKLNPDSRKIITGRGVTSRETFETVTGRESKSQRDRNQAEGGHRWREIFPEVPTCKVCDAENQLVIRQMTDREESWKHPIEWRIGDKVMRSLRNKPPEWFELWAWECPSCHSQVIETAFDIYEERRKKIYV